MTPVNLPPIDSDPDNAAVIFTLTRRPRFSSFRSDPSLRNSSHSAASTQSVPTLAQLGAYTNPDVKAINKDQNQNSKAGKSGKENKDKDKDEHKIKPSKEVEKSGPPIHMIIAGPVNDACMAGMPPMMGVGTLGMSRENCILQSFLAPPDVIFDSAPPSRPISEALKHNPSMPDLTELADYNNNRTSSYSTTSSSSSNLASSIASRRPSPLGLQPPTTGPVETIIDIIPSSDGMVQRVEQQQQLGHSPIRPEHDLQNRLRLGSHYDKVPSPTRKRAKSSARVKEKDRERKTSGFYRVMSFGRKSMSDLRGSATASASVSTSENQCTETPPVPRLPANVGSHKSPFPGMPPASSVAETDSPYALLQPYSGQLFPSTPMSSRSSTNGTRLSSGSSAMSSEGLHTPMTADMSNQGSNPGVPISSVNLQNALRQAEKQQQGGGGGGGRERTKSIGKWISGLGRKSNKSQKSKSGASTPALLSALPSRMPSALDLGLLARETSPNMTLTSGPPDIPLPPTPTIVIRPETILIENESQYQRGSENEATSQSTQPTTDHLTGDQRPDAVEMMRKKSIGKLREARRPSPHPLAVALRRQSLQIPDDLSSALQAGTRVFPNSVNSPQVADTISPAHVGLWPSVAVKSVLINLDNGDVPLEAVTPSRDHSEGSSSSSNTSARPGPARRQTAPQPRGVADFINRPPFEDRNVVYYGSEAWSPVSMARPGQAVESIEHSQYMLALSEADTVQTPWTVIPRASVGGMDDITRVNPPTRAYTAPAAYSSDQRPTDHRARDSITSVEAIDFGRVSPGFLDSEESAETTLDRLSRLLASEPEHLNEIEITDSAPSSSSDESAGLSTATTATSSSSYETSEEILQVKNLDDEDAPLAMVLKKSPKPKPNGPRQPKFSPKKVEPSNSTNMKLNLRIAADKAKKAKSAELGAGVGTPGTPVDYVHDREGEVTETRDQWREESSEPRALAEELHRQQEELQRFSQNQYQYQYPQPQPRLQGDVGGSGIPQRPHLRSRSTSQVPQLRDHLVEHRTRPAEPHHSTSYSGTHSYSQSKYTTPEHTPTKSPKRYTSYYTSPTRSSTQSRLSTSNAWAAPLGQGHYQGMPISQGAGPGGSGHSSGRRPQPIVLPPRTGPGPQRGSRHL